MGSVDDPVRGFHELKKRLEREPESAQGEIARGVYKMTPRPRVVHGEVQGNLFAALRLRFGWGEGITAPEWVAEVLSPTTERFDRREKMGAWGAMGVG